METDMAKIQTRRAIRDRIFELQDQGVKTSKGEKINLSSIGRTLNPPVTRGAVFRVAAGIGSTQRIREAIERELGQPFWIKRNK